MNTLRIKIMHLKQNRQLMIVSNQAASSSKLTCNLHLCKEDSNSFEKSYKEVKCQRFSTTTRDEDTWISCEMPLATRKHREHSVHKNMHAHSRGSVYSDTFHSFQISKESLWDVEKGLIDIMNVQLINQQQFYHATISTETRLSTKKNKIQHLAKSMPQTLQVICKGWTW